MFKHFKSTLNRAQTLILSYFDNNHEALERVAGRGLTRVSAV